MGLKIYIGPLDDREERVQVTTLGGRQRRFRFYWLDRPGGGAAYFDLTELDGTPIALARRLSPGAVSVPDIGNGTNEGALLAEGPDPYTIEQVGRDVVLWFVTPDEVPAQVQDPNLVQTVALTVGP